MAADLHIEDFHQDVARILVALYNRFPQPGSLFVVDLIGEHEPDAFGVPAPRHMACFSTMLWLAQEGFLRYTHASELPLPNACPMPCAAALATKSSTPFSSAFAVNRDPSQRNPLKTRFVIESSLKDTGFRPI